MGDLLLGGFEDLLSQEWRRCLDEDPGAFRVVSAFYRLIRGAVEMSGAQVALVDVGPNLGAINRAALVASSHVVVPVAPDLFSLQGIRNLGPTLRSWRKGWGKRLEARPKEPVESLALPPVGMEPVGYVVLQHAIRLDRPTRAYSRWTERIPRAYALHVLETETDSGDPARDPNCLASLKHYRSLMPLAREARKPIFRLKPADGAIGSHMQAVREVRRDFESLAREVGHRVGLVLPESGPGVA